MSISSRTPEGFPSRCPICGGEAAVEPSLDTGDAPCPQCGHLLWHLRSRFPELNDVENLFDLAERDLDSLDVVELVMVLEEEFDLHIAEDDFEHLKTVSDVIRYLRSMRIED